MLFKVYLPKFKIYLNVVSVDHTFISHKDNGLKYASRHLPNKKKDNITLKGNLILLQTIM